MATAFITHPACLLHASALEHPEQPARLTAIEDQLASSGLLEKLRQYEAPRATRSQLERIHDPAHVFRIFSSVPSAGINHLDSDTFMNPHSLEAALHAAGAVVKAVDLVMAGEVDSAFCAVRPPGHHAERGRAMGFCLFNNLAVGVAHAMETHGLERVAVVDFDIHHGNGTEDIFRDDPRVMLCSSFQHPFYPFSGANSGSDHILPIPLPAQTGGEVFREQVKARWLPALEAFQPRMIFFSAGFDAHAQDPLGQLNFDETDYRWLTAEIKVLAERYAKGRIVSTLEGGYDLSALSLSVAAHLEALLSD
jgi:acetoin utilization deacetylase AcuC-like enzyme